jgi:hypothetical protein
MPIDRPTRQGPSLSTNNPTAGDRLPKRNGTINFGNNQRLLQNSTKDVIDKNYNSGSVNPYAGPTARSLFYNAAIYDYNSAKYGQYLFYSIVGNQDPNFYENYYLSERTDYNSKISETNSVSGGSRNPSAGFLVRQTQSNLGVANQRRNNIFSYLFGPGDEGSFIVGGASAPYYWRDFIYCKYYGHIPNNYMLTLRRFPSPMRDNLSLPSKVKNSDIYKVQGAGRPVAQAVTWFGGNTGNTLSDILQISTGLRWNENLTQASAVKQDGFAAGIFKNQLGDLLGGAFGAIGGAGGDKLFTGIEKAIDAVASSSDTGYQESVAAARNKALRDKAIEPGGPLSEFIWVSVDTVDQAVVRARGLDGVFNDFILNFHYELTSVGEVNSKAAMVDILGNLLALTTNYGNFLTPEIRYDNNFKAVNFPGGDEGLAQFYTDPVQFVKTLIQFAVDPNQTTNGDPVAEGVAGTINAVAKAREMWSSLLVQLNDKSLKEFAMGLGNSSQLNNIVLYALTEQFTKDLVFPSAILSGLPTGEWHLVVGNPCNPIAMMGNLICKKIDITFGEVLGPDDFPTELTAKITLKHARSRERGEIESMFNRGGGRLYQSVSPVYSNSQSTGAFATVNGQVITSPNQDGTTDVSTFYGPGLSTEQYQPDDI